MYTAAFSDHHKKEFEPLFEQARQLPNVNYIGYKPNEYILEHMTDYDLFVYPCIFEETFCVSALEALAIFWSTCNYNKFWSSSRNLCRMGL